MTRFRAAAALLALAVPTLAAAQQTDSLPGLARMRLRTDSIVFRAAPGFEGAGRFVFPRQSAEELAERWARTTRAHALAAAAARRHAWILGDTTVYQTAQRTPVAAPGIALDEAAPRRGVQFLGQ